MVQDCRGFEIVTAALDLQLTVYVGGKLVKESTDMFLWLFSLPPKVKTAA